MPPLLALSEHLPTLTTSLLIKAYSLSSPKLLAPLPDQDPLCPLLYRSGRILLPVQLLQDGEDEDRLLARSARIICEDMQCEGGDRVEEVVTAVAPQLEREEWMREVNYFLAACVH